MSTVCFWSIQLHHMTCISFFRSKVFGPRYEVVICFLPFLKNKILNWMFQRPSPATTYVFWLFSVNYVLLECFNSKVSLERDLTLLKTKCQYIITQRGCWNLKKVPDIRLRLQFQAVDIWFVQFLGSFCRVWHLLSHTRLRVNFLTVCPS